MQRKSSPKDKEKGESLSPKPRDALAILGFAKRFRPARTTEEWIAELRGADLESDS